MSITTYSGTLDATLSVDASGCARYSIQLDLPPATHDVAPTLGLHYASGLGNGIFGVGWSLSGLSSIVRAGQTPAQDGARRGVRYDGGDRFVLDGDRLMVVQGTYGQAGSSYRTELDTYQYVEPVFEAGIDGPAAFVVKRKDGRVLQFGSASGRIFPAPGSNIVRAWALDRVTDPLGNYYTVSYTNDPATGAYYPARIEYTGHPAAPCRRAVLFTIEPRTDVEPRFEGGFAVHPTRRVAAIATTVDGDTVTTYALNYEYGAATGRSRIVAVVRADAAGTQLAPTTFAYADIASPGFAAPATAATVSGGTITPLDVAGNGHRDLLAASTTAAGSLGLELTCALPDGSGFAAPVPIATSGLAANGNLYPIDVDGDGFMEVVYVSTAPTGNFGFTIFTPQATAGGWTLQQGTPFAAGPDDLLSGGILVPGDFDGDGAIEFVSCTTTTAGNLALELLKWDGAKFVRQGETATNVFYGGQPLAMDYDGDGAMELVYAMLAADNSSLQLASFALAGTSIVADSDDLLPSGARLTYGGTLVPVNLTGDQKDDLIYASPAADGTLVLHPCLSSGLGLLPQAALSTTLAYTGALTPVVVRGSSLVNIVLAYPDAASNLAFSTVPFANGTFGEPSAVSAGPSPPPYSGTLFAADVAGWGTSDLLYATGDSTQVVYRMAAPAAIPDVIVGIENGEGRHDAWTYLPLTLPSVYTRTGTPGLDPSGFVNATVRGATWQFGIGSTTGMSSAVHVVDFARFVIAAHTIDDGRGNLSHHSYRYEDARVDLDGHGWLGFAAIDHRDAEAATTQRHEYRQDFPYASMPQLRTIARTVDGALIERHTATYESTVASGVWQVTTPQTRTERFTYGVLDWASTTSKTFDALGNVTTEVWEAGGAPPLYTFSDYVIDLDRPLCLPTSVKTSADANGERVLSWSQHVYDLDTTLARASRVWNDANQTWLETTYAYDEFGNRTKIDDPAGGVTVVGFDDAYHTFVVQRTVPANESGTALTVAYQVEPAFGKEIARTDPNGVTFGSTYDGLGRPLTQTGPHPGGGTAVLTERIYGSGTMGYFEETRRLVSWDGLVQWERRYYDGLHREVRREWLADDGSSTAVAAWEYDTRDNVLSLALPTYSGTPPAVVTRTYDEYERMTSQTEPLDGGGTTTLACAYPTVLREVQTQAAGTPLARTTVRDYATFAGNRRELVQLVDAAGATTTFVYDAAGRLTGATDPGGVTNTVAYDSLNRQVALSVADGTRVYSQRTLDYRDTDRSVHVADAAGNRIAFAFDARGRVTHKDVSTGGGPFESTTFAYDDPAAAFGLDRLCSVLLPSGDGEAYGYDAYGNLASHVRRIGAESYAVRRTFTPQRFVSATEYPDGARSLTVYTPASRIARLAFAQHPDAPLQTHVEYGAFDASGNPTEATYANGITEARPYNALGQITALAFSGPAGPLWQRTYTWDALRRLTAIDAPQAPAQSQTFSYDAVGRLVGSSGPYDTQAYEYSPAGNLTGKSGVAFTYQGHQVVAGTAADGTTIFEAQYDPNGAMTAATRNGTTAQYAYDGEGRLSSAPGLSATYDHDGIRTRKIASDGTDTRYVAPDFEVTRFAAGAVQHTYYLEGPGGAAAQITRLVEGTDPGPVTGVPARGTMYLLKDQIGSTSLVADERGTVTANALYLPYGEPLSGTRAGYRLTFTGRELDDTSQLYYFDSRYYDAGIARFIGADDRPAGDVGDPDTLNRYAYSLNAPIAMIDPDGHFPWSILIDVGLVVAGIALGALTDGAGFAVVASTLTGAGTSGISYDIRNGTHDTDAGTWGKTVGIGAAFGFASGAFSEAVDAGTEAVALTRGIAAGRNAATIAEQTLVARAAIGAIVSSSLNVAQTAATDRALGQKPGTDLAVSAATGLIFGFTKGIAKREIRFGRLRDDVQARIDLGRARTVGQQFLRIAARRLTFAAPPGAPLPPAIQLVRVQPLPVAGAALAAPAVNAAAGNGAAINST